MVPARPCTNRVHILCAKERVTVSVGKLVAFWLLYKYQKYQRTRVNASIFLNFFAHFCKGRRFGMVGSTLCAAERRPRGTLGLMEAVLFPVHPARSSRWRRIRRQGLQARQRLSGCLVHRLTAYSVWKAIGVVRRAETATLATERGMFGGGGLGENHGM
jgi:hypothetical protein